MAIVGFGFLCAFFILVCAVVAAVEWADRRASQRRMRRLQQPDPFGYCDRRSMYPVTTPRRDA